MIFICFTSSNPVDHKDKDTEESFEVNKVKNQLEISKKYVRSTVESYNDQELDKLIEEVFGKRKNKVKFHSRLEIDENETPKSETCCRIVMEVNDSLGSSNGTIDNVIYAS